MKPERIQTKSRPGEIRRHIEVEELLRIHPEWVLQSDGSTLTREWRLPDRRSAAGLVAWLSDLAASMDADPETVLRNRRVSVRLRVPEDPAAFGLVEAIDGVAD